MRAWVLNVSIGNPGEHILPLHKHLLSACLEIGEHFNGHTRVSHQIFSKSHSAKSPPFVFPTVFSELFSHWFVTGLNASVVPGIMVASTRPCTLERARSWASVGRSPHVRTVFFNGSLPIQAISTPRCTPRGSLTHDKKGRPQRVFEKFMSVSKER
jgi:hypothetical protein